MDNYPLEKRMFLLPYFYAVTNGFLSKSHKVLKWGNLDLSYVAGKLTVTDRKYAKPLNLN